MTDYCFSPPTTPSLPIADSQQRFPIHRVYCVGRNYAEHAREMGADPEREAPFFFCKPADAVYHAAGDQAFPCATEDLHHEVELVVALDRGGRDLELAAAEACVYAYAVGIDLTRRDRQAEAKQARRPWSVSKAFDASGPCSPLVTKAHCGARNQGAIWLRLNGEKRQSGDLSQMIWSTAEIIVHLSRLFELRAGDLIFTGTPAGVGPIRVGDQLHAGIEGLPELSLSWG